MAGVASAPRAERRLFEPDRSPAPTEPTLEDLVLTVWEQLGLNARSECPICAGPLVPEGCLDCGAEIA